MVDTADRRSSRRVWLTAFLATLLLHALTVALVVVVRPFQPRPVQAREPEPLQMVFAPQEPAVPRETARSEEPTEFTELPPDRADVAPEDPDFLSNVDSRARDRVAGGDEGAMPRLRGRSEAPHVGMEPQGGAPPTPESARSGDPRVEEETRAQSPSPGGLEPQAAPEEPTPTPGRDLVPEQRPGDLQGQDEGRREAPVDPRDEMLRQSQGLALPELVRPRQGMEDIFQEEMQNPGGDTALFGDVSLNTLAWAYAPWLQRFRRDFVRNWHAPYAYYLGLVDGWTLVELEIAPDGRMLRLDVLEEKGHESLGQQSVASFKATAPFRPLPAGFPEPTLILRIKLIYPPVRR